MRALRLRHTVGLAVVGAVALTVGAAPTRRPPIASPRAILLYGGPLAAPVAIQPRAATGALLGALAPVPVRPTPASATAISVAVFWAPLPIGLPEDTVSAAGLRPDAAEQRGRLYAAAGGAPALLVIEPAAGFPGAHWRVTAPAARLLVARGVPPRVVTP